MMASRANDDDWVDPPVANLSDRWRSRLDTDGKGKACKTLTNLRTMLAHHPRYAGTLRFNKFTSIAELDGRALVDNDAVEACLIAEASGISGFNPRALGPVLDYVAAQNAYDPQADYVHALHWDGKHRIDSWLSDYMGVAPSEYVTQVGSKWLVAGIARALDPGCKSDSVLTLEGPQDLGKSAALRAIAGDKWFGEHMADLKNQGRLIETMLGKWVVEFAELAAVSRSDIEAVKAIITTQVDAYRMAYARHKVDFPRRCVFAATVNPHAGGGYLVDETGNRRFWIVTCTKARVDALRADRDQLWAEARERYLIDRCWWLVGDVREAAKDVQAERVTTDPWVDTFADPERLDRTRAYTAAEALIAIGVPHERHNKMMANRAGAALRANGWERSLIRAGSVVQRRWRHADFDAGVI